MDDKRDIRSGAEFGDGYGHGFEPLRALDLSKVGSFEELLVQMANTAFGARSLGEALEVYAAMLKDPDCFIVGTFSGAMTMAKMGLVVCEMIDRNFVDAIIATGALVMHGLVEETGACHFKYDGQMKDVELYTHGYNRVYDTIEAENNLDKANVIAENIWKELECDSPVSSCALLAKIGKNLSRNKEGRGILRSAFDKQIPIYIPAFTDSELGLDFEVHNKTRRSKGQPALRFDPFLDLKDYANRVANAKRAGIFTIGGGVPRNWSQQAGPYLEAIYRRFGEGNKLHRFKYGVRICPEPAHWGGLSGCTYSEGVSWGKFMPKKEGGLWAEVLCDATIAWPILIKALIERFDREGFTRQRPQSPKT